MWRSRAGGSALLLSPCEAQERLPTPRMIPAGSAGQGCAFPCRSGGVNPSAKLDYVVKQRAGSARQRQPRSGKMLGKLLQAVPSPAFPSLDTPSSHLILSIHEVLFTFPWARAVPSHILACLCPWNVFLCLLPSCSPFPVCPLELLLGECERLEGKQSSCPMSSTFPPSFTQDYSHCLCVQVPFSRKCLGPLIPEAAYQPVG